LFSHSPVTVPRTIGTPKVKISSASSPNVRMLPIEYVNSLSSGNASMTRRVTRRKDDS
jgi:hypothetical protein